jgi:hypothetical protein
MFDQLLNLVKQHAGDSIVNNPQVDNQHNEASMHEATRTIQGTLQQQVQQGNFQEVLSLFGKGGDVSGNPLVGQMTGQLAGKLAGQFGVNPAHAQSIASTLIPQVLSQFAKKTNDPNDSSFDLNDMMSQFTGGKTQGTDFGGMVKDMQQGGKVDFGGLSGMLGGKGGGLGGLF